MHKYFCASSLDIIIRHLDKDSEVFSSCRLLVFTKRELSERRETSMAKPPPSNPLIPNRLLAQLPPEEYERLEPHLKPVILKNKQTLYEIGQPINYVYFPLKALVSVVRPDGRRSAGRSRSDRYEGMTGD